MVTMPNQTGQKMKFRKKRQAKRHVFNFESRLQGFVQIKSLIAGTGCCKCPAFPAFFLPDNTLSKRCKGAVAATLPFVPTHSMLCGFSREKLMNLHILQIDTNSSNCSFGCTKMHIWCSTYFLWKGFCRIVSSAWGSSSQGGHPTRQQPTVSVASHHGVRMKTMKTVFALIKTFTVSTWETCSW